MNDYIKRSDVLALLPDTDIVGYKPSALRKKVLDLPALGIGMDLGDDEHREKGEISAAQAKMEKVNRIIEKIINTLSDLSAEGVVPLITGIEIMVKLADKQAAWMKANFEDLECRAFLGSIKDSPVGITLGGQPAGTMAAKERIAYVDKLVRYIYKQIRDLGDAGVLDFVSSMDLISIISEKQNLWMKDTFTPDELTEYLNNARD